MHGQLYDYSEVNYVNSHSPVVIICNIHGRFTQLPATHKSGSGCPKCVGHDHNVLYFWRVVGTDTYKVGVTKASQGMRRIHAVARMHDALPEILNYVEVTDAKVYEDILKAVLRNYRSTKVVEGDGHTEMYDLPSITAAKVSNVISTLEFIR